MYYQEDVLNTDAIIKDWKKLRSLYSYHSSYHAYFVMSSNTLAQDTEFEVAEDATKRSD